MISLDPLLNDSFLSIVSKGIGANMLKIGSKRRRTRAEIEEENQAEELKQQQIAAKLAQVAALE